MGGDNADSVKGAGNGGAQAEPAPGGLRPHDKRHIAAPLLEAPAAKPNSKAGPQKTKIPNKCEVGK